MNNVTLQQALLSVYKGYKIPNELVGMIYRQLYRKWLELCGRGNAVDVEEAGLVSNEARTVKAVPENSALAFLEANLDWARTQVQLRIQRVFDGCNHPLDDSYDDIAHV